jgi:glycosyltransferase involved in cell wall biosynthesis
MKILGVIAGERMNGIRFHRQMYPLSALSEIYTDTEVSVVGHTSMLSKERLMEFDIVALHAHSATKEEVQSLIDLGLNVVIDFDDYWKLTTRHEMYDEFKKKGETERLIELLQMPVNLTVTTQNLKDKVEVVSGNKSVCVLPNGLIEAPEYRNPIQKDFVNFGWMGASTHTNDLMMIQHLRNGYGFDVCVPKNYNAIFGKRFNYYTALGVPDYLNLYNTFDIMLIPLAKNEFNKYKSELKLIEAGFYKKPVIVSDVEPYSQHLKDGENCLVVKKERHWAKHCKALAESKELRERLGNNLYKDMKEKFDLRRITEKRYKYFKSIIENV